jgi:metallo-beta-lactamase class B
MFALAFLAIVASRPLSAEEARWNAPAAPFRIAGNLYYVGTADLASYLIVDPEGMILLDGGLEASAPLILDNIRALGFDPKRIRYLLNSQAHYDHAGGLAALKEATGAELLASPADAELLERGGSDDFQWGDRLTYPPAEVDARLRDGAEVKLGAIRMTAHLTPGHTRGCTSWTTPVRVDGRTRNALFVCGASAPGYRLVGNSAYPWIMDDFRRSFATWRALPCELFLGAHASYFGMADKRARMAPGRPNPFVDPKGCRAFLAKAEYAIEAQAATQAKAAR